MYMVKGKIFFVWALLIIFSVSECFAQNNFKIKTTNIGDRINSKYADFAPVISADGTTMIFTSSRPYTDKEVKAGKPTLERIYISHYNTEQGQWMKAEVMSESVNAIGRNNSAIALSNDAQRMLLYRDDNTGNGDIYESVLNGTKWSEAKRLPEPVNSSAHESSACYAPDGNTIYFVSNRKGAVGGRDIWECKRNIDGAWSEANPLSNVINTKDDDAFLTHEFAVVLSALINTT